jgi:WD40 repeat protein
VRGLDSNVMSLFWSPDGTRLVSASWDSASWDCEELGSVQAGTVKSWDLSTGACLSTVKLHGSPASCLAFKQVEGTTLDCRDPNIFVTGSEDKVEKWDLSTSTCPSTTTGHPGPVTEVKFASQNVLASRGEDGSTKLWDVGTGQETAEAVPEGFDFSKQGGAEEQKVNGYVVAPKGSTLCIFKAADDSADGATDSADGVGTAETAIKTERAPVAFFQCDSPIKTFDVAGANVAVGCADGQVLLLWAAVLQTDPQQVSASSCFLPARLPSLSWLRCCLSCSRLTQQGCRA